MKLLATVAILLTTLLVFSAMPLRSVAQPGDGTSQSIMMTVYPNTSFGLSANFSTSQVLAPGLEPNSTMTASASTNSNNVTTLTLSGSASMPTWAMSEPPYNYSDTVSETGSYSAATGVTAGYIDVHAVPGLSTPLSSFVLNYAGNRTAVTFTGSSTIEYGNYSGVVINATTVDSYISQVENEGFNKTALNGYFTTLPYANLSVTSLSLARANSTAHATTVKLNFALTGNMTALPAAMATYYTCFSSGTIPTNSTDFPSACRSTYSAMSGVFSSIQTYNYTSSYSNGLAGYSATVVGNSNFNLQDVQQLFPMQMNSTASSLISSVNISGLHETVTSTQDQTGNYTLNESIGGVTVYPLVTMTGNTWNMSAIFDNMTGSQGSVTLVGGTGPQGTVNLIIPSSVPAPTISTPTYATWNNVQMNQLAPVEFTISGTSTATSTSATASHSSTSTSSATSTSSSATKASSNSLVLYGAIGAVAAVAVIAAVFFISRRPGVAPPA